MKRLFATVAIGALLSCASTPPAPPPPKRPPPAYAPHVVKALAHDAEMDRRYPQSPPEASGSLEQDLEMVCELPDAHVYGDGTADERAEALAIYWGRMVRSAEGRALLEQPSKGCFSDGLLAHFHGEQVHGEQGKCPMASAWEMVFGISSIVDPCRS